MEWITLLPPVIAIALAMWKKEVILALLVALWASESIVSNGNLFIGLTATFEQLVSVFSSEGNTRILMFSLLVGALLAFIRFSGGVSAFVNWVSRSGVGDSPRKVGMMTSFMGIFIFIETNLSILTSGILSQSLFDKFKMSRARLAYIIDSTCAPISVLLMLNAWGAYLLSLIEPYPVDNPVEVLIGTIPMNFYALITIALVFYTAYTGRVHGAMKNFEETQVEVKLENVAKATKVYYMLVPLLSMIFGIVFFMWYTGDGEILKGSGSKSVLWSTGIATIIAYALLRFGQKHRHQVLVKKAFSGMSDLLPLVTTVLLALALGSSLRELGTGEFVAGVLEGNLPIWLLAPVTFIAAGIISFTTGTSWGTFGLLTPIAIPIAMNTGIDPSIMMAAVIGGGVFGDHCSPISDTTIVASLAAGVDHLDHVKTQLPYALFAGTLTLIGYVIVTI